MKVGYRRLSGPAGFSAVETGSRGAWWEKRRALLDWLVRRGHAVRMLSRLSRSSTAADLPEGTSAAEDVGEPCDLLVLEFGGVNPVFFSADLAETQRVVDGHPGPAVFLCDDPELWPWKVLDLRGRADRWRVWANAVDAAAVGRLCPPGVAVADFPFAALVEPHASAAPPPEDVSLAYIGRSSGRRAAWRIVQASGVAVSVYARRGEWPGVPVTDPPAQPARAAVYRRHVGCLALADAKHKRLGWRTGRAYHALAAGVPAVVEADHRVSGCFAAFATPAGLAGVFAAWRCPGRRAADLARQRAATAADIQLAEAAARACGL